MRPIPPKMREQMSRDPYMEFCIHPGCKNIPEWEHAFIYAGKQINEKWAIVPCCMYHHRGEGLDKHFNQWVAINRATEEELQKYGKKNWAQLKATLNEEYGPFEPYAAFRQFIIDTGARSSAFLQSYTQDPCLCCSSLESQCISSQLNDDPFLSC